MHSLAVVGGQCAIEPQYVVVVTSATAPQNGSVTIAPAVLHVVPPLELPLRLNITVNSEAVILSFFAAANRTYSVQYRDAWSSDLWPDGLCPPSTTAFQLFQSKARFFTA
jgi:hypothetical protein